jgi:hypothetical protein
MLKRIAFGAALAALSSTAVASDWSTASHLGFAVVDRSTTGYEKSTGSLVFLDVERETITNDDYGDVAFGVRTKMQGAKQSGRAFYRLGAGPLVSWAVSDDWTLQLSAARFEEASTDDAGDPQYKSKGVSTTFGWERVFHMGPRAEIAWGGFIDLHQGDLQHAEGAAATGITANRNAGIGHGVEAALRVEL